MSSILSTVALLGSLAASVNAHGYVQGIVAADKYYTGYSPSFQYQNPPPTVIGWSDPLDQDNGYVSDYSSPDINCHKSATPGGTHATVNGGDKVTFQWTTWPESHHGPVITYLAKCADKCEDADKTALKWFKIDEAGLINDDNVPGTWASDNLISNNQSYTVTIPSSIASGNYVARHEIIALHSAGQSGGAQNYPQCINLAVTSTGSDEPEGVVGTSLYKTTDPGILVNIYQSLSSYVIPGPTLYKGASSGGAATSAPASSAAATSTSSSSPASSAAVTSAAVTSAPANTYVASSTNDVVSETATDVVYATTAVTVTGSAPSATAPLASLASNLPSGALTSAISTGVPSATATGVATPKKPLPEGTTLQDLLDWVSYLFAQEKTPSSKAKRSHARAFRV
ncbi:hypothetical protein AAFC00_005168 [Neodothiora populina]|uniref:Auxiliary Activity family 9 catalytic domain-containing protein n=1 Tax=Neodothiora populina TaxID=2781224 RepID=A0ABR3PK86_9PEZI